MPHPEVVFRHGACSASIFVNEYSRGDEQFTARTVVFQRRYKDQNGEWQSTSGLNVNDIPKATLVLSKAYDYLTSNGEE